MLLFLLGCATAPESRPTPGPPAIACPENDRVCSQAQSDLEIVRHNIGGWCGTPDATAHERLVRIGPSVIPHLRRALHDRDAPVIRFSLWVLHVLGQAGELDAWCTARPNDVACPRREDQAPSLFVGHWTGQWAPVWGRDATPATLKLPADGAPQLCLGDACRLGLGQQTGSRVELTFDAERFVLTGNSQALSGCRCVDEICVECTGALKLTRVPSP